MHISVVKQWINFVLIVVATTIITLWSGFVAAQLWSWFFVPAGWRPMTTLQGAVLYLIVQILTFKQTAEPPNDWERWLYSAAVPLVGLSIGWALKSIA